MTLILLLVTASLTVERSRVVKGRHEGPFLKDRVLSPTSRSQNQVDAYNLPDEDCHRLRVIVVSPSLVWTEKRGEKSAQ